MKPVIDAENCVCGRKHRNTIDTIIVKHDAIADIPAVARKFGAKKVFLFADENTLAAAGKRVAETLDGAGIAHSDYVFGSEKIEPDDTALGKLCMHYDTSADMIVAVGSGVLNDLGKILATMTGKKYMIVATAPSVDGYASASASVLRDGFKISLPTRSADAIIGDTGVLAAAPMKMIVSGLGDMLAKYVSICEWRISHIVTGEYYCESIAALVRGALRECVAGADGMMRRDEEAVGSVFRGLVDSGLAMNYAGISYPASGVEHYISHLWDMRGVEFGTPVDFHGIQCAIGTRYAIRIYEQVKKIVPSREKALAYGDAFDLEEWNGKLRGFLGKCAENMIALEKKEKKYSAENRRKRLDNILANWDTILGIIDEELPPSEELDALMKKIGAPMTPHEIGIDDALLPMTFRASKDIRAKYVLSMLCADLGVLDEIKIQ